jgi:uncharacterized protein YjeT (DUF2065 family)
MRTIAAVALGIVIGVAGLLILQHPHTIHVMASAFSRLRTLPPDLRESATYPRSCSPDREMPCK